MQGKPKITVSELADFYIEWLRQPGQLRFGQAFLNRYYPRIVDPEVFYQTDPQVAYELIVDRYCQPQITHAST
jgi:hypothetical protein